MTVFERAPRMGRGNCLERVSRAGKMEGSRHREADIMVQKRDSPSIWGSGGREELDEEGETMGSVTFGAEVGLDLLLSKEDSTTSSDSRLMGSPIVVSFATLDKDGLSLF